MRHKLLVALTTAMVAVVVFAIPASAASQPIEWASNPSSYRYYLDDIGMGYGQCDWNDYGFRIVKNFSADPQDYRLYSFDGQVSGVFSGKSVIGHDLETANDAYLCTGFTDTWSAGGPGDVESYLFVWVQ